MLRAKSTVFDRAFVFGFAMTLASARWAHDERPSGVMTSFEKIDDFQDLYRNCEVVDGPFWSDLRVSALSEFLESEAGLLAPLEYSDKGVYWELLRCQDMIVFHSSGGVVMDPHMPRFALLFKAKDYWDCRFEEHILIDYSQYYYREH